MFIKKIIKPNRIHAKTELRAAKRTTCKQEQYIQSKNNNQCNNNYYNFPENY